MPQLDSSTFIPQLFWMAIFFCIILIFSASYSLPRLTKVFNDRWNLIQGKRQAALNIHEEADKIVFDFNTEMEGIRKRSHEQIIETAKLIGIEQSHHKKELMQQFRKRFHDYELRIVHKKAQAMSEVQVIAQDLTAAILRQILMDETSKDIVEKAVQTSLTREISN